MNRCHTLAPQRQRLPTPALALALALLLPGPAAWAQIHAHPSAPGAHQPTVLLAPGGVPLVNITTPSAAGVSHNIYRQFDVGTPGAILNNSRSGAMTRLGGRVAGNPWLARGPARVILNEVRSTHRGAAASVTRAAISGIAGDTAARTGDAPTGIAPVFDKDRARQEVQAQVVITKAFGQQASRAVARHVEEERERLNKRLKNAESAEQRESLQKEKAALVLQGRALNILIGAVTGLAPSALLKEGLDAAADQMRALMIEDSNRFPGITDGKTVLSNATGVSEGMDGDGYKLGGTRIDLDGVCGVNNERCIAVDDPNRHQERRIVKR